MPDLKDPRFAPPKTPRKAPGFSWFWLFCWVAKELAVWGFVLGALLLSAGSTYAALLTIGLSLTRATAVAFGVGLVGALFAGAILWSRHRLRGASLMAVLHLLVFGVGCHFYNPSPRHIADEFLAMDALRGPSSLQRVMKIVAPPSLIYAAQIFEDTSRVVRFARALKEQPTLMCPGGAAVDRMACYTTWVNRFRTSQPFTVVGQLVLIGAGVLAVSEAEKGRPGLTGDEKKRFEAELALQLVEAVNLNSDILRSGTVHPWQLAGRKEPPSYSQTQLIQIVRSGNFYELDSYVVDMLDKTVHLSLLEMVAGIKTKSMFEDMVGTLTPLTPFFNAQQQRRLENQKQWFSEFQTWAKSNVPGLLAKTLRKGS